MSDDAGPIGERLAEPFDLSEVHFKPQAVQGSRALAICYIDARAVMDRLDEVLGVGGWQTTYRTQEDGVVCRLRARVGGEWVEHEDVGSFSEQPDDGDKLKAAFSDSLKRAAVHLGIGRYLYRLPKRWVDYDPQKRQIVKPPDLPAWALPSRKAKAVPAPKPDPAPQVGQAAKAAGLPNPRETERRVYNYEAKLIDAGLCESGELVARLIRKLGDLWRQTAKTRVDAECQAFRREREANRAKAAR